MSTITVDEVYNQAQQLSAVDRQQLFDRLRKDVAPAPPGTFGDEEDLREMLRAGLDSGPAAPMTQSDWEDVRQEVRARAAHRDADSFHTD